MYFELRISIRVFFVIRIKILLWTKNLISRYNGKFFIWSNCIQSIFNETKKLISGKRKSNAQLHFSCKNETFLKSKLTKSGWRFVSHFSYWSHCKCVTNERKHFACKENTIKLQSKEYTHCILDDVATLALSTPELFQCENFVNMLKWNEETHTKFKQ